MMRLFVLIALFISPVAKAADLLTTDQAINLALSAPLKLVGTFIPSDSESGKIKACVFRNQNATVVYRYCTKSEVIATSIQIHSNETAKGWAHVYAEAETPVSSLPRSKYYDHLFYTSADRNASGFKIDMTAKEYSAFYDRSRREQTYGCFVSLPYEAENPRALCNGHLKDQQSSWGSKGLSFWNKPSANWYQLQKVMRDLIAKTTLAEEH